MAVLNVKKVLSELKLGESAIIENFTDIKLSEKLLEMGCIPGEKVKLEYFAPFGDPMVISVAGYNLSLRKAEAETVLISK